MKRPGILVFAFAVVFIGIGIVQSTVRDFLVKEHVSDIASSREEAAVSVPSKVITVLNYIREYDKAPEGYVGGRYFGNFEGHLPATGTDGHTISYREWDVNLKVEGQDRGPERLVTGSDGRAWYSPDHYQSFLEVK